jgi:hypothetical protein
MLNRETRTSRLLHVYDADHTRLSKWFYDTSSGTATRVARGGSLIGGTKALDAQGVSYEETRWTRGFMWLEPPEHNTLRPWENESYCIDVCCFSLGLNLPSRV